MYDFTKEELQIIHLDMTIYAEKTHLLKESPSHKSLRAKIQAMIDNYQCKHESDGMCYLSNPPQYKCIRCGQFYR